MRTVVSLKKPKASELEELRQERQIPKGVAFWLPQPRKDLSALCLLELFLQHFPGAKKRDRPTDRQTDRPTDRPTYGQTDLRTDRQTNEPTDRPTDRQTDRPTDRQTLRLIELLSQLKIHTKSKF